MRLTKHIAAVALTLCGLAWAGLSVPAAARVVGSVPYEPHQAPLPAGAAGVAWLDDARSRESWTLWTASYGSAPRRVQRFVAGRAPVIGSLSPGGFTASANHVALRVVSSGPGPPREAPLYADVRTFAGRFGQPLQQVAGCRYVDADPAIGLAAVPFQLRDSWLLFGRGEGCVQFVERDLGVGPGSDRLVARSGVAGVAVAGRFVGWLERDLRDPMAPRTAAVVQDRLTGQEVIRIPLDRSYELSLRDDGTLALSVAGTVLIAEPGAAEARRLPIRVRPTYRPLPWIGQHLAVISYAEPRTLQLIDTDGKVVRPLVQLLPDVAASTATGINATHATWLSRGCRNVLINARPLTAPGTARYLPDRYRCRLRQAGPTVLTNRSVLLGVSCKSFYLDCSADIMVHLGRRIIATGTASRRYRDGTAARGKLRVRPSARRLLRTDGPLELRITARYRDTDSIRRITISVRRR